MYHPPLREFHRSLGASFCSDQACGPERVEHYGRLLEETAAVRNTCALSDVSARGKLSVVGADAVGFLQAMLTSDVKRLHEFRSQRALALNAKGHVLAELRLSRMAESLTIDTEPWLLGPLWAHLERHIISEDVGLGDVTERFAMLSLVGPRAADVLAALDPEGNRSFPVGEVRVLRNGDTAVASTLGRLPRLDVIVPSQRAGAWLEAAVPRVREAGGMLAGWSALETVRIEEGVPRYGAEVGEDTLPMEVGLTEAVAFNKGCYLGQEVIARASFRGQVRRRLVGLSFDMRGPPPARIPVWKPADDARPVGEVRSTCTSPVFGPIGLALVRRELAVPGTELRVEGDGKATVRAIPFT